MTTTVLSTNIAHVQPDPGGADRVSGIDKRPVEQLEVFQPGPNYGDGSGVRGDVIGDSKHHGGEHKAVYAFAREELDHWQRELGRPLNNGSFGENLTTIGIDLGEVIIGQRYRIGTTVLEVSVPRTPCRTFASWLAEKGWVKTFAARQQCGAYFRVIEPGKIAPGDQLVLLQTPTHQVTMAMAFRAKMGDREAARPVVAAQCLPGHHHEQLVKLVGQDLN
ncbi:MOSC domain-containing protein [Corynebacterium sp. A21]|uniref:MOSC domain-containing protein n=1 Tax=Corynebacterium sp. A21 TaxID=3457318 RepID=UPI003FD05F7D